MLCDHLATPAHSIRQHSPKPERQPRSRESTTVDRGYLRRDRGASLPRDQALTPQTPAAASPGKPSTRCPTAGHQAGSGPFRWRFAAHDTAFADIVLAR
jgi:hypothetical protein